MRTILTREALAPFVAERWINAQRHPTLPLTIYNYTPQTAFARHWIPETLACRGLILDDDDRIAARVFPKFFNLDELTEPLPNEGFEVFDKADGSLFIVTRYEGQVVTATRGSFTSPQADLGREIIAEQGEYWIGDNTTYLFELIHPDNRIVIDYGQRRDLELLAVIDTQDSHEFDIFNFKGPFRHVGYYGWKTDPKALAVRSNAEGYVLRFTSGLRVKVKFDEYKRLHRLLTGINAVTIWECLKSGQGYSDLIERVPDEFYQWVTQTTTALAAQHHALDCVISQDFEDMVAQVGRDDRKAFAALATKHAHPSVLFAMLDGKDYSSIIWKGLKPEASKPFRCGEV